MQTSCNHFATILVYVKRRALRCASKNIKSKKQIIENKKTSILALKQISNYSEFQSSIKSKKQHETILGFLKKKNRQALPKTT